MNGGRGAVAGQQPVVAQHPEIAAPGDRLDQRLGHHVLAHAGVDSTIYMFQHKCTWHAYKAVTAGSEDLFSTALKVDTLRLYMTRGSAVPPPPHPL